MTAARQDSPVADLAAAPTRTPGGPIRRRRLPRRLMARAGRWVGRWLRRGAWTYGLGWLAIGILWLIFPFPRGALKQPAVSVLVTDADGRPLRSYVAADEQWFVPQPLSAFSPWLLRATVASEDRRFYEHGGVDPLGVGRAVVQNVQRRETFSGASTITMQTVRLLGLRPGRHIAGKAVEAFRALQLERELSKDEILAWYLNLAPYGGNVRGAEAAAWRYFNKPASELSLAEAAALAGLPQSPARYRPDRHPEMALARRDCVLWRMRECGEITEAQYRDALAEPMLIRDGFAPFAAPHFADAVHAQWPDRPKIRTTLDGALQHVAEAALAEGAARRADDGVFNGAVVIVENRTGSILAMVGNVDFFDAVHQGQVNGATARRSPGSALKPFTYALAFEAGIATPDTVLFDVPSRFAHYRPDNFDRAFLGPMPAAVALAASRNVPAVELAREVGVERLYLLLRGVGLTTLTAPPEHYGLSLTMGSAEVTLVDLTAAYATLARGGAYLPPRWTADEADAETRRHGDAATPDSPRPRVSASPRQPGPRAPASPRQVLSAEAAYLVTECLSRREALADLCPGMDDSVPRFALKTGTSQGRRDAWAVGYDPQYTVGVWLGNFDGRRSDALVGREAAAPIVVRIIRRLYQDRRPPVWFTRPAGIGQERICTVSGLPAGPHCEHTRLADCIPAADRQPRCRVCRRVWIDVATGRSVPDEQANRHGVIARTVQQWPAAVAAWMRQAGRELDVLPEPLAAATSSEAARPRILSPANGQQFILLADRPAAGQQVTLRAAVGGSAAPGGAADRVFWFLNDELFAAASPDAAVQWPLAPGRHTLRCVDACGRWSTVRFEVR